MAYKQAVFASGEFYHVFNRGVEKRTTFLDKRYYERFIETLNFYKNRDPKTRFSFRNRLQKNNESENPLVEIVAFCLMPNHFHLLLKQVEEKGITTFLSKVTNSYTKYFNTKQNRVGPLFQGSFKAVRVEDDEQLIHLTRYIHLNPLIDYLVKNLNNYPYSSYNQYLGSQPGICQTDQIMNFFKNPSSLENFTLDQEEYGRSIKKLERLKIDEDVSAQFTWKVST